MKNNRSRSIEVEQKKEAVREEAEIENCHEEVKIEEDMEEDSDENFVDCLEEINNVSDAIDRNNQAKRDRSPSMRNVEEKGEIREEEGVVDHHKFVNFPNEAEEVIADDLTKISVQTSGHHLLSVD